MTRTYEVSIPLRLAVEADSRAEAVSTLLALWEEVCAGLPTGASAHVPEENRRRSLDSGARIA